MARPKKVIDKNQFEQLCAIQCTESEIISVLGCDVKTLYRWIKETYKSEYGIDGACFSNIYKIKSEFGKMSLRRTQFKMAQKYPNMAIFLGKQYLGQKDNQQESTEELYAKLDALLAEQKADDEGNK